MKTVNEWNWKGRWSGENVINVIHRGIDLRKQVLLARDKKLEWRCTPDNEGTWDCTDPIGNSVKKTTEELKNMFSEINNTYNLFLSTDEKVPIIIPHYSSSDLKVKESTMTGDSSGSYQIPLNLKENNKMKNNLIEITEAQFEKIVKNVLLKEFVYSSAAASATNVNTKKKPTGSTAANSVKAAGKSMEPNVKDERPLPLKSINDGGKQTEDQRIEREAGGMQDLEYDSLSEKAKKNITGQFTAGDNARSEGNIGNAAGDTTVGKEMLDRAKKRKQSKDKSTPSTISLGGDIELNPGVQNRKKLGVSESIGSGHPDQETADLSIINAGIKNKNPIHITEFETEYLYDYDDQNEVYKKFMYIEEGNKWDYRSDISPEILRKELNYIVKSGKFNYTLEVKGGDILLNYDYDLNKNPWEGNAIHERMKYKKYVLKNNSFLTEEFIDGYLTKHRKFFEGKLFFIEDKHGNRAKIRWAEKYPIVEEIVDLARKNKWSSLQERLFKNEFSTSLQSSRLDEHSIFVDMFKRAKKNALNEN